VLRGGFGLWLGDNIVILSMVKGAHLLLSNIFQGHVDQKPMYSFVMFAYYFQL
jgi:hypothetical protein